MSRKAPSRAKDAPPFDSGGGGGIPAPAGQEDAYQHACERTLDQLQALGRVALWYHVPKFRPSRERRATHAGLPDLVIVLPDGAVIMWECKAGRERPTVEQQRCLDVLGARGGWGRSLGEFLGFLRGFGVCG